MEKINKFKKIFNKLYYEYFIENFKDKISFNFPKDYFRWDLIDYLIQKNSFENYLEIGCDDDQLFSKISISDKIGVDPNYGGNLRKTSDQFFHENKLTFDCIFIDGLHTYKQVKKDILNSIKFLNNNGFILVHDCLPSTLSSQAVPRYKMLWHGDVWKAIVDFRRDNSIEIFTCLIDWGIAIIQKKENSDILKIDKKISKLKFKDFYLNHKRYMRPISYEEFKAKF